MTIVFLCGCIEPGRDGVGDYTRKLAAEIFLAGHSPIIVSINDKMVDDEFQGNQDFEGASIPVVRLPQSWSQRTRLKKVQYLIDSYSPDWVSLQFVPFSFHKKGLPYQLGRYLASTHPRFWHVMIHELWVGMDRTAPAKFRVLGFLQKRLITALIKAIDPQKVHTQSSLYLSLLHRLHISSERLPLFGNISVAAHAAPISKANDIRQANTKTFVLFGGIHHGAPIHELALELKNISAADNSKIILKLMGRCGPEQTLWEKEWQAAGLTVKVLGEQTPEVISREFLSADFGITTTPWLLIEKSGSVAAMQEHGLPILCVSRNWEVRQGFRLSELTDVVRYEVGMMKQFLSLPRKEVVPNRSKVIAEQFLKTLFSISHGKL